MNFKRIMILASLSISIGFIILIPVKWSSNIASKQHNRPEFKSETLIDPTSNPIPQPVLTPEKQDASKMITFPEEGVPVLMYHSYRD